MAVMVYYNSWYTSLLFSAKQQHETTKFCIVWRTCIKTDNFYNWYFKFYAVFHIQFQDSFDKEKQTKWLYRIARFVSKKNHFWSSLVSLLLKLPINLNAEWSKIKRVTCRQVIGNIKHVKIIVMLHMSRYCFSPPSKSLQTTSVYIINKKKN